MQRGTVPKAHIRGNRNRSDGSMPLDRNDHVEYNLQVDEKNESDDEEETNANKKAETPVNSVSADFRDGKLPGNVHISTFGVSSEDAPVDLEEFEEQSDGSFALRLSQGKYIKLDMDLGSNGGGKLINNYTITMDVCINSLTSESLSLYQSISDPKRLSEGEAFVYQGGGVGVFGEVGDANSAVQLNKWNRIVITVGPQHVVNNDNNNNRQSERVQSYESYSDGEEEEYRQYHQSNQFQPRSNSNSSVREMTTYVNSKKCTVVKSIQRPVLSTVDGKFALNTKYINFFSSSNYDCMPTDVLIKYLDVKCTTLNEVEVRTEAQKNRIFSSWEKDREKKLQEMQSNFVLKPIFKKPPPVWMHPSLMAEFGDAYLEGTGLDSLGDLGLSCSFLSLAFETMLLTNCYGLLSEFNHEVMQSINYFNGLLKNANDLFRRFALVLKNGPSQLIHFMKRLKKLLGSLQEGQSLLIPGGINSSLLLYLVEYEGENNYRFVVVNTDPNKGLDYHPTTAEFSPKLMYQTVLIVKNITKSKMMNDAFWLMLFNLSTQNSPHNTSDKLYNLLLPFLVDKPLEQVVYESECELNSISYEWRPPQRAKIAYYRTFIDLGMYIFKKRGISSNESKKVFFAIKYQYVKFIQHDMTFVAQIRDSDRRVVALSCEQLAYEASKLGSNQDNLTLNELTDVEVLCNDVLQKLYTLPCPDSDASANPPFVNLTSGNSTSQSDSIFHPFYDRLLRKDDVDGLAGAPIVLPKYVPIDYLKLPVRVNNLEDAVAAIRYCDRLCTLISVQSHCIKNRNLQKVSLIQYVLTTLLPLPKSEKSKYYSNCIWRTPMRYGLQLDLTICLGRILEHFMAAAFSLHTTKSLDAIKLIITTSIGVFVDCILRRPATDQSSEFCMHLCGYKGRSYGLSIEKFKEQTEFSEIHTPELLLARSSIIEYFEAQTQKGVINIFKNWASTGPKLNEEICEFFQGFNSDLAYPAGEKAFIGYIIQGNALLNKNYPEWHVYRDISYYINYVQNVDVRAFPPKNNYEQIHAELQWQFQNGQIIIEAYSMQLECAPQPPFQHMRHRFPSLSKPGALAPPHDINTEDDVLHVKNLPSFGDNLGQADCELFLSYLTVPYLRIPLVLALFSTEDRVHSLKSEDLQVAVDAVIFEPGAYLSSSVKEVPKEVPTSQKHLLATSYGLLLNELVCSPHGVINSITSLVKLAINLDIGSVFSSTVPIIFYVLRLLARLDNFITLLLDVYYDRHECISMSTAGFDGFQLTKDTVLILEEGQRILRSDVQSQIHKILEDWSTELREVDSKSKDKTDTSSDSDSVNEEQHNVDDNTVIACQVHAHLLLLYRNYSVEEYTYDIASTLASSFVFLTTRHTWNLNLLTIPEHEMFEMLMMQRRKLINWTRLQNHYNLCRLLESCVRVSAGTGCRDPTKSGLHVLNVSQWAYIRGVESAGRFSVSSSFPLIISPSYSADEASTSSSNIHVLDPALETGISIDLQTAQLTLKSSHMQALDTAIASDLDVQLIFGSKSMQASTIESTEHRNWVHLVGRGYDIQYWRTPDQRTCSVEFDRDYGPGVVEPSEEWIVPILEPVRLTYLVEPPFTLQICMPEKPLPPDAEVAVLVGIHPKQGGTWKEILVYKSLRMVQVYQVMSHGRRFYRSLEYCSDTRYSLRSMQPSLDDRQSLWPVWERHGAGHPYQDSWKNPLSCIISRGLEHEKNLSGCTETFIPERLLYGIIPAALLETYTFWQDEDDNLRGYPNDSHSMYMIICILNEVSRMKCTLLDGVCATITRVVKEKEEVVHKRRVAFLQFIEANKKFISFISDEQGNKGDNNEENSNPLKNRVLMKRIERLVRRCNETMTIENIIDISQALFSEVVIDIMDLLTQLEDLVNVSADNDGDSVEKSIDQVDLTLIQVSFNNVTNSKYGSVLNTLSRLENASHILCWCRSSSVTTKKNSEPNLDLIELPRLNMSFQEKLDENGVMRLYSLDHVNLFVTNQRSNLTTKLMRGIPHSLLLSTTNGELHLLVPVLHPVRPMIVSNPFSTELVMNRLLNPDWYSALEAKYHLYSIHVSLSFLFSPTLASSLYLLLLRLLHRSYDESFRLANTIGTDVAFSVEENVIFSAFGQCNNDFHPDAHAVRLKIWSVMLDAPSMSLFFNPTRIFSRYITTLSHVSAVCRIEVEDELRLVEGCICSSEDARFYDEEGKPLYTLHEVTIVKNRKFYTHSLEKGNENTDCFIVPRQLGTNWPCDRNFHALMVDSTSYMHLEVSYAAPGKATGQAVLSLINNFWDGMEDQAGNSKKCGFLFIYELLTGTKTAKVLNDDVSIELATLLFELMNDKDQPGVLTSILSTLCKFPSLIPLMPKFKDDRQYKNTLIKAAGDEGNGSNSPLLNLLNSCIEVLQQQIENVMSETVEYNDHPITPPASTKVLNNKLLLQTKDTLFNSKTRAAAWIIPKVSDFSCNTRDLIDINSLNEHSLNISRADLEFFSSTPLGIINIDDYIQHVSRDVLGLSPIGETIPFDVSNHEQSKSAVAKSMLDRLKLDTLDYAKSQNNGNTPKLKFILALESVLRSQNSNVSDVIASINQCINELNTLILKLSSLREVDSNYIEAGIPWLLGAVNVVNSSNTSEATSVHDAHTEDVEKSKLLFKLKRCSKQESLIYIELLLGTLISSNQIYDLKRINPFLLDDDIATLNNVIVALILHSNRVGLINRCVNDANELLKSLSKLLKVVSSDKEENQKTVIASALLNSDSLARNMISGRHYVKSAETTEITNLSYDPRYLLFEFTWNIMLRKSQISMVIDYMDSIRNNKSMVKQMIMGAGKTTVVCPLLTLLLGDGNNLVMLVVPPALLDFSRSIMRNTFSTIMYKSIFTFSFDRSSAADPNIYRKFSSVIKKRGICISTPTSVKSIMLKFLELLTIIKDQKAGIANYGANDNTAMTECLELGKSLKLFQESVLIMDEVDLILHPMKSELNFPIGEKHELDFSPQRWLLPIHLIDSIFYAEKGKMTVNFNQSTRATKILELLKEKINVGYEIRALQRNPHIILLNPDWYFVELVPILAQWLYMFFEANHMAGLKEQEILTFLVEGANNGKNSQLAIDIEQKLSPNHVKMLTLGHSWLNIYLPHILQKVDRVSFGIMSKEDYERAKSLDPYMPRTRAKLAIPFVGKDVPSRSSEFAHPDIILGLTILAYRYEGLRWTDFTDMMTSIRAAFIRELGPYNKRKSNVIYKKWVKEAGGVIRGGGDENVIDSPTSHGTELAPAVEENTLISSNSKLVVSLRLLKRSNEDQMKKIYKLLKNLPNTIHYYLENFVFPVYMDNKITKLSAAGCELGGEMLFKKRIGFSGTPSDLLPIELGKCHYEIGSDGQMISVLTSPEVCSYEVLRDHWSPVSILTQIATSVTPKYNALIDTGALITGLTNLQVAQKLLELGLPWCEGIVFLDELDRKMVLVRTTGRVLKMSQCGIPAEKRFAFYDQIHTTGMDINHILDAKAVLTLSKDMVFRDIAQGAYRMRGINKGQTIHLYIIPEVKDLLFRELSKANITCNWDAIPTYENTKKSLCDVIAWLLINSMKSERVQYNQLCLQNVANVYRKGAFTHLIQGQYDICDPKNNSGKELSSNPIHATAMNVFCEPIDFALNESIEDVSTFADTLRKKAESNKEFINTASDRDVVDMVISNVSHSSDSCSSPRAESPRHQGGNEIFLSAEIVQEQEQEIEQEQEEEQEIEIEKYVDLAYSREMEAPTPWPFNSLATSEKLDQFYPLAEFKLYKRNPLPFPDYLQVSNNYFNCQWNGARRIKNVVMILDLVPDIRKLICDTTECTSLDQMSVDELTALETALSLFDVSTKGHYTKQELNQVLQAAAHVSTNEIDINNVSKNETDTFDIIKVRDIIISGKLSLVQSGRQYIALSLAEAETIRCIIHRNAGKSIIPNAPYACMALRCLPIDFSVTDFSHGFLPAEYGYNKHINSGIIAQNFVPAGNEINIPGHSHYMSPAAQQSLRFLNCDFYYDEKALNILLRAFYKTNKRQRRNFFSNILLCRRRLTKKWNETPVNKLFTLSSQYGMLKQRAVSLRFREGIQNRGMLLYDAFNKFNSAKNGLLSPAEVWSALNYIGVDVEAIDVLDFVSAADVDNDGNISYKEFVDILREFVSSEEKRYNSQDNLIDENDMNKNSLILQAPELKRSYSDRIISPKGVEELQLLQEYIRKQDEEAELAEKSIENEEEERIKREIEFEEDERDRLQEGGRNPQINTSSDGFNEFIRFDFSTGRLPRYTSFRGDYKHQTDEKGIIKPYLQILPNSFTMISTRSLPKFHSNLGGKALNQYSITMEMMIEKLNDNSSEFSFSMSPGSGTPSTMKNIPLFSLSSYASTDATIWCDSRGKLSLAPALLSISNSKVSSNSSIVFGRWHVCTFVFDSIEGSISLYLDGSLTCVHTANEWKGLDGPISLGTQFSLFGTKETTMNNGGNIRSLFFQPRCLTSTEVSDIALELKQESQSKIISLIVDQLMSMMGYDYETCVNAAKCTDPSGSLESRIEEALNYFQDWQ